MRKNAVEVVGVVVPSWLLASWVGSRSVSCVGVVPVPGEPWSSTATDGFGVTLAEVCVRRSEVAVKSSVPGTPVVPPPISGAPVFSTWVGVVLLAEARLSASTTA